jgi:hypothetical protein
VDALIGVLAGLALSAAAGLRVLVPLPLTGLAARLDTAAGRAGSGHELLRRTGRLLRATGAR